MDFAPVGILLVVELIIAFIVVVAAISPEPSLRVT